MTYITEIKQQEINDQVEKILAAYSAMNAKINTIFAQQSFEKGIDIDPLAIGLDVTKLDTTSLKSIQIKDEALQFRKQPKVLNQNSLRKNSRKKQL